MIYSEFKGKKLSMLGMGGMRFPLDENGGVDIEKTAGLFDICMKNGVNYYDSARFYHNGESESIMGRILSKYDRESFYFATKMPWQGYSDKAGVAEVFERQLAETGLDYFDFYLLHNVSDSTVTVYNDEGIGVIDYLVEQRKLGRIRHLGFSTHASLKVMEEFLEKHSGVFEFCQIQLNWLDYTLQNAREKVELLKKYKLPVWVMEPLRGGKLASFDSEEEKRLKDARPQESVAAWSFRFLQGFDNVKVVLSGMSDKSQVYDNVKTFSEIKPLNEEERKILDGIAQRILSKKTLTCTGCRYCVEKCPSGLDIPKLLSLYNNMCLMKTNPSYDKVREKCEVMPDKCIGCKVCEAQCPQEIKISGILAELAKGIAEADYEK